MQVWWFDHTTATLENKSIESYKGHHDIGILTMRSYRSHNSNCIKTQRCERPQTKNEENSMKLGKNAKIGWK